MDFTSVGNNARPSARMLKKIATLPVRVISQATIPSSDKPPHTMSNVVIFQTDLRFRNELMKTISGPKPTMNVMIAAVTLTPSCTMAENAISGASAHKNHVTRLGVVLPLMVLNA